MRSSGPAATRAGCILSSPSCRSCSDSSLAASVAIASPPRPPRRHRATWRSAPACSTRSGAVLSFYRAVHAQEVRRLMDDAHALAEEALRAADARYQAGDTAVLDVNVARVELARARRDQLTAASRMEGTLAELREVLALPS